VKNFFKFTTVAVILFTSIVLNSHSAKAESTASVPVRNVFESLGSQVSWDNSTQNIIIHRGNNLITLKPNSSLASKNSEAVYMDSPVYINSNGQSMISSRFVYKLANTEHSYQTSTYQVKPGDSLWKISHGSNLSVEKIKSKNLLSGDMIMVGQILTLGYGPTTLKYSVPMIQNGVFPLLEGTYQSFGDTYGDGRSYGGERKHEGNDIMAQKWTPIFSVADGIVTKKGWNTLGGWTLNIKVNSSTVIYYAHMVGYAPAVEEGSYVTKGQIIGYIGNTGYGPVGTFGKFETHLHFGMYNISNNLVAFNPFKYLKYWEANS
jgi:LysM repeat protein